MRKGELHYSSSTTGAGIFRLLLGITVIAAGLAILFWEKIPLVLRLISGSLTVYVGFEALRDGYKNLVSGGAYRVAISSHRFRQEFPNHDDNRSFDVALDEIAGLRCSDHSEDFPATWELVLKDGRRLPLCPEYGLGIERMLSHLKEALPDLLIHHVTEEEEMNELRERL